MPKTASEIYEIHNLDTNIGHGKFKLSEEEAKSFYLTLQPINKNEILNLKNLKIKWWDEKKIKNSIKNNLFLTAQNNDFMYAIDPNGTVYFWIK